MRKWIQLGFWMSYGISLVMVFPFSLWLLLSAPTWVGRSIGSLGLMLLGLSLSGWRVRQTGSQMWGWIARVLGGSGLVLVALIIFSAPSGQPGANASIQQRFTQEASFSRFALANIVPESEQLHLGYYLMTPIDPHLTWEQARQASEVTEALYAELEADTEFHAQGSALGLAYRELLQRPFDLGHYYLYIPKNASAEPLPAVLFLHGSVGNFKGYSWIWSQLAEQEQMVIIAPSYGFGNWDADGVPSVLAALEDAQTVVDLDPDHIYLAGLSNGGLGVSHVALEAPERFRGLIFISPVMATEIVDQPLFQAAWQDRPVLVISGEADRRIPVAYVGERVRRMTAAGIDVESIIFAGEDHFLFFAKDEEVMGRIADWLVAQQSGEG